uniref:HCG19535 n=2 Tax=Fundulus heteroclitus TaxID=8078 RepID=A0A147AVR4_FUNHE
MSIKDSFVTEEVPPPPKHRAGSSTPQSENKTAARRGKQKVLTDCLKSRCIHTKEALKEVNIQRNHDQLTPWLRFVHLSRLNEKNMFSFFGRKDSKKSPSDKEADGGFVIVGEIASEQKQRIQTVNIAQPSTNVIVQPSKSLYPAPSQPAENKPPTALLHVGPAGGPPAVEVTSALPDLLGDVPFMLAPHVLAMQAGSNRVPDVLLSRDINYNLASFQYDFTLENSVLHNS